MARITSKSLLLEVAVSIVLVFLAVIAILPWIGALDQRDQSHSKDSHKSASQEDDTSHAVTQAEIQPSHSHEDEVQIGSPIASANYIDTGYLQRNNRGQRDRKILVCDYSRNGKKAEAIARNYLGFPSWSTYDVDGAGGWCWSVQGSINAEYHNTCNWHRSRTDVGCGPYSRHPR